MKYLYVILLLAFGVVMHSNSNANTLGIETSYEDNTAKCIRLAGEAIEKKHYSSAIEFLNIALRDIKRLNYDGYNYEYGMYTEQIKEIEKLIEYCKILERKNMDYLKIKLIASKNITNMSYMFSDCKSILSISSKWNFHNVTDMSYMFSGCESLISISDFSNLNTKEVTDMSNMFSECKSIKTIPDHC